MESGLTLFCCQLNMHTRRSFIGIISYNVMRFGTLFTLIRVLETRLSFA